MNHVPGTSTPDLASVLATLSQFAPSPHGQDSQQKDLDRSRPHVTDDDLAPSVLGKQNSASDPDHEKPKDPRLRPQQRSTGSPKPMIDPATITTWQDGLRCVTKIAASNFHFATTIKRMMAEQRSYEMRWYSERQALKQSQALRSGSSAKAASILQSLSTVSVQLDTLEATDMRTEEDVKSSELAALDRKIYSAQQTMDAALTAELKGLGVPFFGTDDNLVVADGFDVAQIQVPDEHAKWSPIVSASELIALRRKMIGHLEDLYRD